MCSKIDEWRRFRREHTQQICVIVMNTKAMRDSFCPKFYINHWGYSFMKYEEGGGSIRMDQWCVEIMNTAYA